MWHIKTKQGSKGAGGGRQRPREGQEQRGREVLQGVGGTRGEGWGGALQGVGDTLQGACSGAGGCVAQGDGGHAVQGTGDTIFLPFPVEGLAPPAPGVSAGPVRWGRTPCDGEGPPAMGKDPLPFSPARWQLRCPTCKGRPELSLLSTRFCAGACPELTLPPRAAPQGTRISHIPGTSGTGDPALGMVVSGAAATHCYFHIPPPEGCLWRCPPCEHGHRVLVCSGLCSLTVTPSSLWQRGRAGEAARHRGSKKTLFPAKFLDTFPFTQLRLEKHQGQRDFPPSR